jgi:hypothetical protein
MDLANRVSATYAPLDTTVYPPVTGSTTVTLINEDTVSQTLYGIIEKIIGAGTVTDEYAEKVRDMFLSEMATPARTGEIALSPGSAQAAAVTLDCLGNVWWFTAYVYNNSNTGLAFLSDKLVEVVLADPNGVFSTDLSGVAENLFLVPEVENENRFAWDVIAELVGLGNDADDQRAILALEDNRVVYSIPEEVISYQHQLSDPRQGVVTPEKMIVYPWDVKAGRWLQVPDFLIGRNSSSTSTDLRLDPRNKFIESVRYTAPWGLDLSGGKTDRLSQLLAKLTFTGGIF